MLKKIQWKVVGIVYQFIIQEKPDWAMIDIGGLGAGIYDRLKELLGDNHHTKLLAVNAGSSPFQWQQI